MPSAGLLRDGNGNLFGVTAYGGVAQFDGRGTVFELSRHRGGKWTFSNPYIFCAQDECADGYLPNGGLIADTSGNLYGVTAYGGSSGYGAVYELSPAGAGWSYTVLHNFSGSDGAQPSGGLRYVGFAGGAPYDGLSALYGSTQNGGAVSSDGGTIYQLMPGGGTLTTIHSFSDSDVDYTPFDAVTLDATGTNIYGVSLHKNGTVFRLTNAGGGNWNKSTLYDFGPSVGDHTYYPFGSLVLDSSGSLIGTTSFGGPNCHYKKRHGYMRCGGSVFTLTNTGSIWAYSALHEFCAADKHCPDGSSPYGALFMDTSGSLYGTTGSGGTNGKGVAFRIRPGKKLEVLYDFCSLANCSDGASPAGSLVSDGKGHLYGVTSGGGANNGGTVFELTP